MSKTKVCILQNGLARGGTDTFVVNLCKEIDKDRFDITVVNPSIKPESQVREPEILATGAKIVRTSPLSGGKSKLKHLRMLYRLLKDGKFDVFQTNIDLFNGPNLLIAWLAGVPVRCCHSHNTMQQKSIVQGMTLPIRLYQAVMKWMCWTFSNRRSGCSEDAMNFLFTGKNWHQDKYPVVVNNGIDIDRFRMPIGVERKKKELGLTAKYHIVTVGRIIPQKNPLFIAESFAQLCKMRTDVDFAWVGIGDKEEECREILKREGVLKRVHFLGSRTDVNEILPCCDLFYMPSVFEGLGIVIIEAQAAGLPCIASDTVPKEANCGAVHYISLDADKSVWAQAMSDVLDGKLQLKADEESLQQFSIHHMAEQMMQVFSK